MRTLGIDLATRAGKTGVCCLDWSSGHPVVVGTPRVMSAPSRKVAAEDPKTSDAGLISEIVEVLEDRGWVGIDAPFGFPAGFSTAVGEMANAGVARYAPARRPQWLDQSDPWDAINRRVTDGFVHQRLVLLGRGRAKGWPMSSVVEQITPTAVRCAQIRSAAVGSVQSRFPKAAEAVVEVYPVAALRVWGIATGNYKKDPADCEAIMTALTGHFGLAASPQQRAELGRTDDAVDALVCALVARQAATEATIKPSDAGLTPEELGLVQQEGWIHLPVGPL